MNAVGALCHVNPLVTYSPSLCGSSLSVVQRIQATVDDDLVGGLAV